MEQSCASCEEWRTTTRNQHAQVWAALAYDKRTDGGQERASITDLPELRLFRKDSLEPHTGLQDVSLFDSISEFPCKTLFRRRSSGTWCRHRNPLMDPAVGVGFGSLMVDKLDTLHLCPAQFWVQFTLWQLMPAPSTQALKARQVGQCLYRRSAPTCGHGTGCAELSAGRTM